MIPARKKYLIFILSILYLFIGIDIPGQDSHNGYWLPVTDTLRIFLIYAELTNDPDDPGIFNGWKAGALPPDPGFLFDHRLLPGEEPEGMISKYYYQASFGKYIVLADYYPEIVSIDYSKVIGRGFNQVLDKIADTNADDIITRHGYSINSGDFDLITTSIYGSPKEKKPDLMIDMVMVIWRVNSKMTRHLSAGFCVPGRKMYAMKDMKGMNSYSSFVNKDYRHYSIIRHEFSHMLLGGNNFHTGGSGAGTKTFMSSAGGYAMLSSFNKSAPVYCAFDRRRLGWKHSDNRFQISARDPVSGEEINADLVYLQDFHHGSNEFILRDFVQTGDVIRIELPYLQAFSNKVQKQWLWLENHQKIEGNIDHEKDTRKGLYAYIQVGKEILSGLGTYGGNCNYTWPVSAFGNYDFRIDEEAKESMISNDLSNPFTGYNNLIYGAYDLKDRDGLIYRDELFLAKNLKVNGEYPDSSVFNIGTYPLFGTSMDAFQPGGKIGIDRNPVAVPVMTYQTSSSVRARPRAPTAIDNRTIHLNGISVEFTEQLADGSIKLKIRWDDRSVEKNVRWCGDIYLHEELTLEKSARILLDQGITPQKPMDPLEFNGQVVFTDSTRFTLTGGSGIRMKRRSKIIVDNNSTLILDPGSIIDIDRGAKLIITESGNLIIHPEAKITGKGKIIFMNGSSEDQDSVFRSQSRSGFSKY